MNEFSNKLLILGSLLVLFAIAPVATYGQDKAEKPQNVNVVNTANVNVANTPKVLNANDSNIFQETRVANGTNDALEVLSFTVPEGKRLVIEFASVRATIGKGEKLQAFITGGNGFTDASHPIVMNFQQTVAGDDIFVGAQQMRMYVEPGRQVQVVVLRRDAADTGIVSSNANLQTSISGYLVDVQ
jgi:hypothetical protein